MNKSQLIAKIADITSKPKKTTEKVVNLIFDLMTETLADEGRVEIRGFGTFSNRKYEAYTGRNPRNGEFISVGAKSLPYFKPGKEMKLRVDANQ